MSMYLMYLRVRLSILTTLEAQNKISNIALDLREVKEENIWWTEERATKLKKSARILEVTEAIQCTKKTNKSALGDILDTP